MAPVFQRNLSRARVLGRSVDEVLAHVTQKLDAYSGAMPLRGLACMYGTARYSVALQQVAALSSTVLSSSGHVISQQCVSENKFGV